MSIKKLTLPTAKKLQRLKNGEILPYSSVKNKLVDELIAENIVWKKGKHRQTVQLTDSDSLDMYLANQLQINDLSLFIETLENENCQRADLVIVASDSKYSKQRSFTGFLVNSYQPIQARLHQQPITIFPQSGTFMFIADYEHFDIDEDVVVIGVENAENFRYIEQQKYLFTDITPLFISRYPQSQHKDFIRWMRQRKNRYWHFGDFDVAGIGIYLNEYKKYLGEQATFFIPTTIHNDLSVYGNRALFHQQSMNFNADEITEESLQDLIRLIQQQQKGLEQEFYVVP